MHKYYSFGLQVYGSANSLASVTARHIHIPRFKPRITHSIRKIIPRVLCKVHARYFSQDSIFK